MAAVVYHFPSMEDQQIIRSAVTYFLQHQTGKTRDTMHATIRAVLDSYRISKFSYPDYTVMAAREPLLSKILAKVIIQGNRCLVCNENIYSLKSGVRILSIQEYNDLHYVTYGCKCGVVFAKMEQT